MNTLDLSLRAPKLNDTPGVKYGMATRNWQGIPGIERTAGGRLWAAWYSGGAGEGPDNYVVLVTSEDGGKTWSEPKVVIDPPDKVRAYDPSLWLDPMGRIWLFWAQSYDLFDGRCGVWASVADNPDSAKPVWSAPRRLANGIMMNKPIVLANGEWIMPSAVWAVAEERYDKAKRADMTAERFSNVYVSADKGMSWTLRGGADMPDRTFDEHMVVERKDGALAMFIRAKQGVGQSISKDGGRTWSRGVMTRFSGPNSRHHIRRLQSGRLLMVYHDSEKIRQRLAAWISDDDGGIWIGPLILDERDKVSYPDATQSSDGRVFVVYDRDRGGDGDILMAVFREEDVLAKKIVSGDARMAQLVNRLQSGRVKK